MKLLHTFLKPFILAGFIVCLFSLSGCDKVEKRDHLENDNVPPGPVTEVTVENLSGGAIISYQLPEERDVLYVQAEYEIRDGIIQEARSSYYNNSLKVFGFGDSREYTIDLYTVDRSGNRSEKISTTIYPTTPPVQIAFEHLEYESSFGGIHISSKNDTRADLVVTTIIKNEENEWVDYDKYYSALPTIDFAVRGLDAAPTEFGVYIIDRWENSSDTLTRQLTPLFEKLLDKKKFKELKLANDPENVWALSGLWDDVLHSNAGFKSLSPFPKSFQFNIGETTILSRFRLWGVSTQSRDFLSGNIKEFEVYGSQNPDADGSYESWTLLGSFEIVKPSGLPAGELTADDIAYAAAGFEFEFPAGMEPVSYLRFKVLSTFSSPRNSVVGDAWLRELSIWGQ